MKLSGLFITSVIIVAACNNRTESGKFSDLNLQNAKDSSSVVRVNRTRLIRELKKLRDILSSGDKEKIADIFPFPLADTTLAIFVDDSSFTEQYKINGDKTSRAMFIRHFNEISDMLQLSQLNRFFQLINPDSLFLKDTLTREVRNKKNPCYNYYNRETEPELVKLSFGSNFNEEYKSSTTEAEESSEYCEYTSIWIFRFDTRKLIFLKQIVAG